MTAPGPAPAPAPDQIGADRAPEPGDRVCHLHGIVPVTLAGTAVLAQPAGGADGEPLLVPYRRIAALARLVPARPASQLRRELMAHAELLDRAVVAGPVLPMRFGTVLASPDVVRDEVLIPHHDFFAAALATLAGRAQFTVRARYIDDAAVREALATEPRIARLHQDLHRRAGGHDPARRLRLGELVSQVVADRREADSVALADALRPHAVAVRIEPAGGDRIADAACLVELRHRDRFEAAVAELGRRWHGRARLRLCGPMAPYHFVGDLTDGRAGGGEPWGY
jgi:hypothetical protein